MIVSPPFFACHHQLSVRPLVLRSDTDAACGPRNKLRYLTVPVLSCVAFLMLCYFFFFSSFSLLLFLFSLSLSCLFVFSTPDYPTAMCTQSQGRSTSWRLSRPPVTRTTLQHAADDRRHANRGAGMVRTVLYCTGGQHIRVDLLGIQHCIPSDMTSLPP